MEVQGQPAQLDLPHSLPLSVSQREVWLDQRAWPDSVHLNIGGGAFLHGRFDLALLKTALLHLAVEHEALRLVPNEGGTQTLLVHFEPVLELVDVSTAPSPLAAMQAWWAQRISDPFPLGTVPPWRFALLRGADDFHSISIQFHHLVMDGWGTTLIGQRWSEIYNALLAGAPPQPPGDPGYLAFIEESSPYRASPAFERDAAYWHAQLPFLPDPLVERRYAQAQPSGLIRTLPRAQLVVKPIARADYDCLVAHAVANGVTAFHLFFAALVLYFARTHERQQIVVGVPSLNRGGRRYRETLGMFVGVMAVSISLTPGMTGAELLAAVATAMRGALRHPRYPLSELGRTLEVIRSGREGLFDLLLSFERQDYKMAFGQAELVSSRQFFTGAARYPLGVTVCEFHAEQDVELILEASAACFAPDEAALMGERLWTLVQELMAQPETPVQDLPVVPAAERAALLATPSSQPATHDATPTPDAPPEPFITQFLHQVALRPTAVALVWDGGSLTYAALDERASHLARRLRAAGAGPDKIVALAIERCPDMVVAILAIAKAGAAFLPLDPDAPTARLADILAQSSPVALLIQDRSTERLAHLHTRTLLADWHRPPGPTGAPAVERRATPRPAPASHLPAPGDLAYVLFTSGSTGRPKGVMIEHAALSRRLAWLTHAYGVVPYDRSAQATQITFDPSLIELCLPLIHGGSVALPPPGRVLPEALAEFAVHHGVTIMAFVPSTLSRFLEGAAKQSGLKLRVACCGGEVLSPELVSRFLTQTRARLFNVYGPTETTIFATAWECRAPDASAVPTPVPTPLPIGRALADTRIYVLDTQKQLLPYGVSGEIYIGGGAVGRGYLNRPDLTQAAFVLDPFVSFPPQSRMYRTGDRGWLSPDGNLHFLGRLDRQVKLRGYRIELGEIEAALGLMEGVTQAAAQLTQHGGKPVIHAWVGTQRLRDGQNHGANDGPHNITHDPVSGFGGLGGPGGISPESLQRALRVRLPDYMVPSAILVMAALPHSSAGKIDYHALPEISASRLSDAAQTIARAPTSRLEFDLLALWREVLQRPEHTVEDNFFDAGGDSLAAVSLLTGIEKLIGRRVPLYLITERPTVAGLASALAEDTAKDGLLIHLGAGPAHSPGRPIAGDITRTANGALPLSARPVLYLAASGHGDLMRFQNLARALGGDCDLRMLQPPSASTITRTIDLAGLYADSVQSQGAGPCYLAGFSVGGLAALETACQLRQRGASVQGLFLIDTIYPSRLWGGTFFWRLLGWLVRTLHIEDLSMNGRRLGVMLKDPGLVGQVMAVSGHRPRTFDGPILLIKSAGLARWNGLLFSYWKQLLGKNLTERKVQGLHGSMFDVAQVSELAQALAERLAQTPALALQLAAGAAPAVTAGPRG